MNQDQDPDKVAEEALPLHQRTPTDPEARRILERMRKLAEEGAPTFVSYRGGVPRKPSDPPLTLPTPVPPEMPILLCFPRRPPLTTSDPPPQQEEGREAEVPLFSQMTLDPETQRILDQMRQHADEGATAFIIFPRQPPPKPEHPGTLWVRRLIRRLSVFAAKIRDLRR